MTRYSKQQVDLSTRVLAEVDFYGSYRAAGKALGCDAAYLNRLAHGKKTEPSDDLLKALRIRRVVFYETVGSAA